MKPVISSQNDGLNCQNYKLSQNFVYENYKTQHVQVNKNICTFWNTSKYKIVSMLNSDTLA